VAIYNLLYIDSKLEEFDAAYKVMPPLRTKEDIKVLVKAVKDGIIDLVTSDHIPINIEEKQVEFENAAFGSIGLESAFGCLSRIFDTGTTIELLTKGRERYGLKRPKIKEDELANLTLFDPAAEYRFEEKDVHSISKNSMFLHEELKGRVYGVINKGQSLL